MPKTPPERLAAALRANLKRRKSAGIADSKAVAAEFTPGSAQPNPEKNLTDSKENDQKSPGGKG